MVMKFDMKFQLLKEIVSLDLGLMRTLLKPYCEFFIHWITGIINSFSQEAMVKLKKCWTVRLCVDEQ
jgi:hypothetical protein